MLLHTLPAFGLVCSLRLSEIFGLHLFDGLLTLGLRQLRRLRSIMRLHIPEY